MSLCTCKSEIQNNTDNLINFTLHPNYILILTFTHSYINYVHWDDTIHGVGVSMYVVHT